MTESREKSLAKNTGILAIGTLLPRAAAFITLPILTAFLTKEEYGSYDLVLTIVQLLLPAATLQIQMGAFRFLIDARDNAEQSKAIISSSFAFMVPISIVVLLVYFFVTNTFFLDGLYWDVQLLSCGYYFINILSNEALQCMRGLGYNKQYSISCVLTAVVQLGLTVLFIWVWRLGLRGAVLLLLIASLAAFVYQIICAKLYSFIDLRCVDRALILSMLGYSWPMVPNSLAGWAMRLSNRLVITFFMGAAANAAFAVAYKIPQVIALAQNTFTMAWQENASIANKDEDANVYYSNMFETVIRISAGLTSLTIAVTPALFMILVQGDYADGYAQVPILTFAMYWVWIATFFSGIYVAYMKSIRHGMSMTVAAVINLAIDIITVPHFGLYGASMAYLVSYIALAVFRMVDVRKLCKVDYKLSLLISVAAVLVGQCMLLGLATPWIDAINATISIGFSWVLNRKMGKKVIVLIKRKLHGN